MTDGPGVPRSSYGVVVLGGLGYTCMMFSWFSHAAFLTPIVETLDLTGTQSGLLVGAIPLVYVPFSIVTGVVTDRVGARRALFGALALIGVAQVGRGLAGGYPALLGATVLLGIGATGITLGLPKLVADLFPSRLLGTMSTVYVLGSYAGTALVFTAKPALGAAAGGWRPVFVWTGVAVLAFAGLWLAVVTVHARRYPARYGGDTGQTFTPGSIRHDLGLVFRHRGMRLLVVIGAAYLLVLHGLQGWLPRMLELRGLSADAAGWSATSFVAGQAVGTIVVPPASDRLGRRRAAVAVCGATAVGGIALLALVGTVPPTVLAGVAVGIGIGGVAPLLRALPTEFEEIGPGLTATAVSLVFAVGEFGGFAGPFLVGSLRDLTGSFVAGLAVLALGGVAIFAAALALPETRAPVADRAT
ncbi:MFS transporter [Halobacteriales archaeon QS_1_68_17]|nr:MAG: MFS transporter [Halobacteriales archaeon QS_1_68_17]